MLSNLTEKELNDMLAELENKYQKLLKLAKKMGEEMDTLHDKYVEIQKELKNRKQ